MNGTTAAINLLITVPIDNPGGGQSEFNNGEFSVTNEQWQQYPSAGDVPKPEGPFRMIEGAEYKEALAAKNKANAAMHAADPSLKGMHIHEVKPVKFGGSPNLAEVQLTLPIRLH